MIVKPGDINKLPVYRMIPIQNLAHDLEHGLYSKKHCVLSDNYKRIGSKEIINQRDTVKVKCHHGTFVNDYVPFYFSFRTPMLYNIHTGHGVPSFPQRDIIYLCCRMKDLACDDFQWCFTNGNAAKAITKFYTSLDNIESDIDWRSINTTDFRDENSDGDEDRVRKKHAEFLVYKHVPAKMIKTIVVISEAKQQEVHEILSAFDLEIKVLVKPQYYF